MFDMVALEQSGIVMLIGMVVIFLFMALLIVVINLTTSIAGKLGWGSDDEDEEDAEPAQVAKGSDDEAVAAIAAATAHSKKA
jgi:sodium pump decarboxylase gamma subunit